MIIKYSDKMMENFGKTIFDYKQMSLTERFVNYIINSKYRKSVLLKEWINQQVNNITPELVVYCNEIKSYDNYDTQILAILKHVQRKLRYVGDNVGRWKMPEYWQSAQESVLFNEGDCEDGSILMYILARMKGIPSNRLMLFAGSVQSSSTAPLGGHCWLGYKPNNFPNNFVFIDWCYYADFTNVKNRNKFSINGKSITEYKKVNEDYVKVFRSKYRSIWFGFQENVSITKI